LAAPPGVLRPGIVHRLDKGTSGLMVVAKDDLSHTRLCEQFKARTVGSLMG
jgi:23S rRNA pseudouridine1911/1915/1917 synthase